jgi:ferredoxin
MCVLTAPDLFSQNSKDGRATLVVERLEPARVEAARQAVALCPSGALSLVDEG